MEACRGTYVAWLDGDDFMTSREKLSKQADFLDANPGLRSRFGRIIHFPDYDTHELVDIFERLCTAGDYTAGTDVRTALTTHLTSVDRGRGFGNGRLSRTLFERGVMGHASRVTGMTDPSDDDLTRLMVEDLRLR